MNLSLVVMMGSGEGKEIPIRLPQFIVGRDPDCQLRPASALISKKHCMFLNQPTKVIFKDFGSTNGSFVNDVKLEGECELKNGDVVKFGPLVFRVKLEASAVKMPALSAAGSASTTSTPTQVSTPRTIASAAQGMKRGASHEEDIAAMLFNFADAPSSTVNSDSIPTGTTVAGLDIDPTVLEQPALPVEGQPQEKKNTAKAKYQDNASTSAAAQQILDKYMRRPR